MGCIIDTAEDYGYAEFATDKIVTARKQHKCDECNRTIEKGERYERVTGKWDGEFYTFRTCSDCLSLRKTFFCTWRYEELWNDFWEDFCYWRDDDNAPFFYKLEALTTRARDIILEAIEDDVAEGKWDFNK